MENRKSFYVLYLTSCIFLVLLSSCQPPSSNLSQKIYFDLPNYFDQQVKELQKDSLVVIKTSEVNGNTDQHQMDWTDWKKEFSLFYASDISKSSFIGKYKTDSVQLDSSEKKIIYLATDSSLRTKLIEITYSRDSVKEVHVVNHSGNFLSRTSEELYYEPRKSYIIKSSVTNRFFGVNEFSVLGQLVSKQKQYF
ncbi:MAG: hypothetical protein ACHQD9_05300 [Chitinophagales bacterium]